MFLDQILLVIRTERTRESHQWLLVIVVVGLVGLVRLVGSVLVARRRRIVVRILHVGVVGRGVLPQVDHHHIRTVWRCHTAEDRNAHQQLKDTIGQEDDEPVLQGSVVLLVAEPEAQTYESACEEEETEDEADEKEALTLLPIIATTAATAHDPAQEEEEKHQQSYIHSLMVIIKPTQTSKANKTLAIRQLTKAYHNYWIQSLETRVSFYSTIRICLNTHLYTRPSLFNVFGDAR